MCGRYTVAAAVEPTDRIRGAAPGTGSGGNPIELIAGIAWLIFGPLMVFGTLIFLIDGRIKSGRFDWGLNPFDDYNVGRAIAGVVITSVPYIVERMFGGQ
jgi:hypothetical protein